MANIKIIRPRVTEKATTVAESGIHVFEIEQGTTKREVAKAVEELYKVKPVKVHIVKIPRKQVFVRGKKGFKAGGKKAYVYLKKGEKIEII